MATCQRRLELKDGDYSRVTGDVQCSLTVQLKLHTPQRSHSVSPPAPDSQLYEWGCRKGLKVCITCSAIKEPASCLRQPPNTLIFIFVQSSHGIPARRQRKSSAMTAFQGCLPVGKQPDFGREVAWRQHNHGSSARLRAELAR